LLNLRVNYPRRFPRNYLVDFRLYSTLFKETGQAKITGRSKRDHPASGFRKKGRWAITASQLNRLGKWQLLWTSDRSQNDPPKNKVNEYNNCPPS
jgi:hypothetical protein